MAAGKKNATRWQAHLVFLDGSGFLLIPTLRRTWAPCGQTPRVHHYYRHDRLPVISGLSLSPVRHRVGLYFRCQRHNIRRPDVVAFLRHLLRHLGGAVIVLLDNAPIHKGEPLRELCQRHPRLHLEFLPPYAPELNPDEGVWADARARLAKGSPR